MDCPVLPCILPSTAFPCSTETHTCRDRQRAEGLPAKGLFLGSPYELWDGMGTLISSPRAPGCYLSKCSQQWEVDGLPMAQDAENPIQVDLVLTETAWKSGRGRGAKAWLPHCPLLA